MFKAGSYVVYGVNGVCKVEGITAFCAPGSEEEKEYYVLEPLGKNGGIVYVPLSGNKITLRPVMTEEEALALIKLIPELKPLDIPSDKHREEEYKKAMTTCDSVQWVRIIRTLHDRKEERIGQGKQVTSMDTRYWKAAEHYLYSELAIALSKDMDEIEDFITEAIQKA